MLDEAGRRKVVDKFLASLEGLGSRFNTSVKAYINSGLSDSELAALFGQIDFFQELTEMGYLEEVEKYMREHEKVIEDIIIKARQRGVDITGNNIQQLESVMLADEQFLLRRAEMFGHEFKSAILKPLIAGVPRRTIINELLPQIQAQVPFKPNWLDTAINQSFTAFDNVATQQAFKDEPDLRWVLVHPQDANTRRICNHAIAIQRENPAGFTIEEINSGALNEGFIARSKSEPQVYTFENLGGFNCRGWWAIADEAPEE